jgi:hypothetical protein
MAVQLAPWDLVLKSHDELEITGVGFRELLTLDRCHNQSMRRIGFETMNYGGTIYATLI